jgi:YfiH family protein
MNPDWLVPQWPAPANVHAVCTTRAGGQSLPPFDSMNLGDHVGDNPQAVDANRALLRQALGVPLVFLSQVHGKQTIVLSSDTAHGTEADGCLTTQVGVACTVLVADCLPVLLCSEQGHVVAAAHAGWRGLLGQGGHGILEQVIDGFRATALMDKAQGASKIIAWLGPCIGPLAFEVGGDMRDVFMEQDPAAKAMFVPGVGDKWLANLPGLARLRLASLGVTQIFGNNGSRDWCTVSQPSRFFSYRRDGVTGRLAACIWRS